MTRIAITLLALLAVQGLVSLTARRSLLWEVSARLHSSPRAAASVAPPPTDEGAAAAARGPYAAHPDARVGRVLRASAEITLDDVTFHSDELGLRARPGPPAGPEALRVAVLGGSVAFGCGLSDTETLAARLETLLSQALGGDAAAAPVACRTIALPDWNERNAVSFLLDHLDLLDPQLVVFLAEPDQLYDTEGVDEQGDACWLPDPASADRWLPLTRGDAFVEQPPAELGASQLAGAAALQADLTRESQRRYDENAALLVDLAGRLRARGAALLVAHAEDGLYALHLGVRLNAPGSEADLPEIVLFSRVPGASAGAPEGPPHAQACDAMAHWIAAECLQRGWVRGLEHEAAASAATALLEHVPAACALRRAAPRSAQARIDAAAKARAAVAHELLPAIDLQAPTGAAQILGGVRADGSIGTHALCALARVGPRLRVRVAPLPGRPDLYPLPVAVEIDGQHIGKLSIVAGSPAERTFALPADLDGPAFEVRLIPERSIVLRDGAESLAAFRLLQLACVPE